MDDYYKAAWLRYKNCKKEDANYYLNLMTDEEFYHTADHAVDESMLIQFSGG